MNHSKKLHKKEQSSIVFMPIKPIFVERILSGEKLFEFRRTSVRQNISHLIVYSSSPVKRVVAVVEVVSVITASPTAIWEETKQAAGITRKLFREYFRGAPKAHAIEIGKIISLERPLNSVEISSAFNVPQSFSYVDQSFLERVIQLGIAEKKPKSRSGKLIFVGGIHGAGKSSLCASLCREAGFVHLTASDLIRNTSPSSLGADKKVNDVEKNQEILVNAFSKIRQPEIDYVLDGHFTLLDGKASIQPILLSTFEALHPDKLIVVTESAEIIASRLKSRDRRDYDDRLLAKMQCSEISHAKLIGDTLKIAVHEIQTNDSKKFFQTLQEDVYDLM